MKFQKIQISKTDLNSSPIRVGGKSSRPTHQVDLGVDPRVDLPGQVDLGVDLGVDLPRQVDSRVDLGVDLGVDLAPEPDRAQPPLAGLVCVWSIF